MKSVFQLFCVVSLLVAGDSLAATTTSQPLSSSCTRDDINDFYMNQLQWDECQSSATTLFNLLETTNTDFSGGR